jgi:hypothetical protein
MQQRKGDWIQTYVGVQFWPLDARVEDVNIRDIAHSLANQCRFAGHTKFHYSVAQHSVYVSYLCNPQNALWGLLHDATEAYLVDLPRPIKKLSTFSAYVEAEASLSIVVCDAFDLPREEPADVHEADMRICATEARDLIDNPCMSWLQAMPSPYELKIVSMTPQEAERIFLLRYKELVRA